MVVDVFEILGIVDVDDGVLAPRVIEDALGRRRFAGVDVGDDADIADIGKGDRTGHIKISITGLNGGAEFATAGPPCRKNVNVIVAFRGSREPRG